MTLAGTLLFLGLACNDSNKTEETKETTKTETTAKTDAKDKKTPEENAKKLLSQMKKKDIPAPEDVP